MSKLDKLFERLGALYRWVDDRFNVTLFASVRVTLPPTFSYVLSNLGMATVLCFVVTVVTGMFLLLYYRPTPWNMAYDSIKYITEKIAFGHTLRGVHYHGSNAMVFLAIVHAAYVFFRRLYKGRFDFLWITGVILGVATVIVAFTGYVLIFNDRAVEAQSIMLGITGAIHPALKSLMAGTGLSDRALRLYAFHIGIIPAVMIALMAVHLPRALRISIPMAIGLFGALFLAAGIYPAELGPKFDPALAPEFMPPEWYFLWVYSLLRTWAPVVIAGVLMPGALIVVMMAIPWLDIGRRPRLTDRPVFAVIGMTSITYWIYLTIRGMIGVGPPALQIPLYEVVGVFIATAAISALVFRLMTPLLSRRVRPRRGKASGYLAGSIATGLLMVTVGLQAILLWAFTSAYIQGLSNLVAIDIGLMLFGLGIAQHVYAVATQRS